MKVNFKYLSARRNELYGLGALGVLIVHSLQVFDCGISIINNFLSLGGIGTYIFCFLSGIGLYHSMRNNPNIKRFYANRWKRTFRTYVIIVGLWYFVEYFILSFDLFTFAYELSTVSFWLEHKGAWYIAMLVPLYIIYPWFYQFTENNYKTRDQKIICCGITWFVLIVFVWRFNNPLYEHLKQVYNGICVFIIGHLVGKSVYEKKYVNIYWIVLLSIFYPICVVSPLGNYSVLNNLSFALWGIAISLCCGWGVTYFKNVSFVRSICNILELLGKMSLELYLTNLVLIQIYNYFIISTGNCNSLIRKVISYGIIVIIGIFVSLLWKLNDKNMRSYNILS